MDGFVCSHCQKFVSTKKFIGTHYRNHCPFCLWSKHVDLKKSSDRQSLCHGQMEPIGLTFKHEGSDKYDKPRQGELMLIHQCQDCGKININRIAADDDPQMILKIFGNYKNINEEVLNRLKEEGIHLLTKEDKNEVVTQLFGKANNL